MVGNIDEVTLWLLFMRRSSNSEFSIGVSGATEEIFAFFSFRGTYTQNFVPQGLIPRRTLLGGVSDPTGCCFVGYQTPQNKIML
jgi:hypothetical protein